MTPERKQKLINVLNKRQANFTVVLENIFDPHNVAAVMRSCDSVGIQDIYIITNRKPPRKRWGFKSSSGAKKWLTIHEFTEVAACMEVVKERYGRVLTTKLATDSVSLYDTDFTGSTAVVFGNEHMGVSDEMASYSDGNIVIPQVGIIQSLNISVACAVTIYEAFRQKSKAGHYQKPSLSVDNRIGLLTEWGFKTEELPVVEA